MKKEHNWDGPSDVLPFGVVDHIRNEVLRAFITGLRLITNAFKMWVQNGNPGARNLIGIIWEPKSNPLKSIRN